MTHAEPQTEQGPSRHQVADPQNEQKPSSQRVAEQRTEHGLSRQQVAERLIDIAYVLTVGDPLELTTDGRRTSVPVSNELLLERELTSNGDQAELELRLTWPTR